MATITEVFGNKLRLRVSGILIHNDSILLVEHKSIGKTTILWAPPGGGLQFGEDAETCLIREFKEETNLEVSVGKLLFVNEYLEPPLHAIELFFEIIKFSGELVKGTDPEMTELDQIIKNVKFITIDEIKSNNPLEFHSIFQKISNLHDFNLLSGYYKNSSLT